MKAGPCTGLIAAGGVNRSFVARMPLLLRHLGPVKAASFRVARRIVNSLRAGHAVTDYAALDSCGLIWIAVPESTLDRITHDFSAAVQLRGKPIVLCDVMRDSLWPGPLLAAGARVATLNVVEESRENLLVAEGDPGVVRELQRLADTEKRKLIELHAASKPLYFSGVHLATHLLLPWIASSVESLRAAGFSRVDAARVSQALGTRALRAYGKAGRKAWSSASAERLRQSIQRDLETIRATDPRLAALYADGVAQALRYFELKRSL